MRRFVPLIVVLSGVLSACATPPVGPTKIPDQTPSAAEKPQTVRVERVSFAALQGWELDDMATALSAFQRSCARMLTLPADRLVADNPQAPGGRIGDWQQTCREAQNHGGADGSGAQQFFEAHFTPYRVFDASKQTDPQTGLFTGYYIPQLNGTWVQGGAYQTPLLARPADLVSVNLGAFDEELGGNTIWGRVENGRLQPYPDRRAIESGALADRAQPLLWVDSAVDAFFLHVQGSGQVRLVDGTVRQVGFAGKNGQPYKSIGRLLIDRGEIPADHLTMDAIRDWVDARPDAGLDLLRENPSYVFFRLLEDGPMGAQGVTLTAERSLAVDLRYMPLGAPVWMQTHDPLDKSKPFNRLMIAQDTGGAIKGVVRGDIFFGAGELATKRAGNMKRPGQYFILLPNGVTP